MPVVGQSAEDHNQYREYLPGLLRNETVSGAPDEKMYCDDLGLVTTGIGNLLATADDAAALEWWHPDGLAATAAEVAAGWAAVKAAYREGRAARWYYKLTEISLTPEYAEQLALRRLAEEFLPACRREFPGFDALPPGPRFAIVDVAYNAGIGNLHAFVKLRAAVATRSWAAAAAQCSTKNCRPDRLTWRHQQMLAPAA